jgi:hypothetical protein
MTTSFGSGGVAKGIQIALDLARRPVLFENAAGEQTDSVAVVFAVFGGTVRSLSQELYD